MSSDPSVVQPVASRYTDYGIPACLYVSVTYILIPFHSYD
jgi:hypothetical protein